MKKKLFIMLAMATVIGSLAGCGSTADVAETTEPMVEVTTGADEAADVAKGAKDAIKDEIANGDVKVETPEAGGNETPVITGDAKAEDISMPNTFSSAEITVVDFATNESIADNANYVAAKELDYESIPADYEWYLQNNQDIKYADVSDPGQELFNNQDVIFAGFAKIAKDNGYGDIASVNYFIADEVIRASFTDYPTVSIEAKCYAAIYNDGNNRIEFIAYENGTNDVVLTTDVRPLF